MDKEDEQNKDLIVKTDDNISVSKGEDIIDFTLRPETPPQNPNFDELKAFLSQTLQGLFANPDMLSEGNSYTIIFAADNPIYNLTSEPPKSAEVISFEDAKKRLRPVIEADKAPQDKQ